MSRRARIALVIAAATALAVVLVVGVGGLPAFGHFDGVVGRRLSRVTVAQRHTTDVITAINFDYRGLDTMGEEFILFASSLGLVVLLRELRGEAAEDDPPSPPVAGPLGPAPLASAGRVVLAPMIVLGIYVVVHGQLTPGGGFQGGVILASAVILAAVSASRRASGLGRGSMAETLEAVGAGGYVVLGIAGVLAGARFLANVLPLGTVGSLLSGGTIASLSAIVGLEVAGAFTAIVAEFAVQERMRE